VAYDRSRGNRRNWYAHKNKANTQFLLPASDTYYCLGVLVCCRTFSPRILAWEDGFCNFAATTAACGQEGAAAAAYADCEAAAAQELKQSLQPELFFKMSHDIYNYGEG
jgi:hypothetical protein